MITMSNTQVVIISRVQSISGIKNLVVRVGGVG